MPALVDGETSYGAAAAVNRCGEQATAICTGSKWSALAHDPEKLQTFRTRSCAKQKRMIPKSCRLFGQDHARC
jgi:hypothetical protein